MTRDRTGTMSEVPRAELLNVAGKYPVHRLLTQVTTEVATDISPA